MNRFEFEVQRTDGFPMAGNLNAASATDAQAQLHALGLQVISLRPGVMPSRGANLSADDLSLFNEQLIQLTTAGLPMERGLSLLAADLKSSRLKTAMQSLAADLSAGQPLEAAIELRKAQFPPIYARLIDAGVRTSNLPGVLHGFGKHLETVSRLKSELWRACAYPLMVLLAFGLLLIFLGYVVLPQYYGLLQSMGVTTINWRTGERVYNAFSLTLGSELLYFVGRAMPYLLGALLLIIVTIYIIWALLKSVGREGPWVDRVVLRIPLLGRALRHSYVARWVDTLALSVRGGLDLPKAMRLAAQVIALPSITQDSETLVSMLESGQRLDGAPHLRRLPASVPPAIQLASGTGNLPEVLDAMARQFERQTEHRIRLIPATLLPILVLMIGVCAGAIIYGLWTPLTRLITGMSGGNW